MIVFVLNLRYVLLNFIYCFAQALDIVKQAKVATILGDTERRKPSSGKDKTSRRGSRESLDMTYDAEDVSTV